ncbi:hypothetical protein Q5P01_013030 [Channa striata]|uniref:RHD domain-containing protein n=1 Tax=Channa striata TaxID=64152 RepID=A0AA88STR7_CHASR|nr:hypothetical protein Q5P01_013030 [Channa striata]
MSTANCAEELDFRLIFEEDGRQTAGPDLHARTAPASTQALGEQPVNQELQSHPPCFSTADRYQSQGPQYGAQGNLRAFDCPSIQITSIAPNNHVEAEISQESLAAGGAEGGYFEGSWSRDQLYLSLEPCYRDPALSASPCSSLSSRSWMSDVSSCESYSNVYDDVDVELHDAARLALGSPVGSPLGSPGCGGGAFGVELWQQKYQHPSAFSPSLSPYQSPRQSPRQSPCHSPRTSVTEESWLSRKPNSRPTSPCGKRRHTSADPRARSPSPHHSPSPTPGASPRGSVTDDTWLGSPGGAMGSPPDVWLLRAGCPLQDQEDIRESAGPPGWCPPTSPGTRPKPGNPPLFGASAPPPLDCPLPSQFDQFELKIEVQPKSYHRAHYETEGSRGSIKAPDGHPVVKLSGYSEQRLSLLLFIGTADDRYLRPHSFYQVHRVTGKTVTTTCQENTMGGTKVLEIPLLPENNMSVSIDCAGILKLRNADIELKKGETDIGRKNTRVRVVFRVAVPQPDGQTLWLQAVSAPVECSQRSGQELPQVETFSPVSCSVDGGEELLITGSNISVQSRVVFAVKGSDGRSLWEMDGRVVPEKSSGSSIVVEVPRYNKKVTAPVQVQFYISNGKRKRSLTQSITFLPGVRRHLSSAAEPQLVKQEHWELDPIAHNPPGFSPDMGYFDSSDLPVPCGPSSQNMPHLHHPPPRTTPIQAPLMFAHTPSSMPSQTSSSPHQTLIPLQPSIMSPQTFTIPPQTSLIFPQITMPPQTSSVLPQTFTAHPHTSSLPPQTSSLPVQTSPIGTQRERSPSLSPGRSFVTPTDPQKHPQLSSPGEVLNIKQEPEDPPNLRSLGLQEITLDDVNEIIDRDISNLSSSVQPDQFDQYHQYDWEHKSNDAALPFCGGPQ